MGVRQGRRRAHWVAIAMAVTLGLAGCGDAFLGAGDPPPPIPPEFDTETRRTVPVQSVAEVELGRTRDGFLVTATGTAPGLGYATPQLVARRDRTPGPDGFLDFDFVVLEPLEELRETGGGTVSRRVRAVLDVPSNSLRDVTGIRVHGARGGIEVPFASPS